MIFNSFVVEKNLDQRILGDFDTLLFFLESKEVKGSNPGVSENAYNLKKIIILFAYQIKWKIMLVFACFLLS